ncbi:hypothetical protein BDP27DRAFT_1424311 [Rhodocollybia butyracea]|uniref:Uncharacterized protein n=1 Tax=Rhodocollybia butyracea TaxID=206335 RepID=A0A9P5PHT4_9AGAR|nr:hypothetical protein BDP27DRAFT_1424311 [Rhodocollybia butyracea]
MLNYDVIMIICANTPNKQDLLSLALTSKVFLEPVLDVLWKKMTSLQPLLSVLPETTLVNGQKMFLQPIAPSSWDRLRFYTSRVREFDEWEPYTENKPTVHYSVTPILTQKCLSSNSYTLFLAPTLQEVSWPCYSVGSLEADRNPDLGPSFAFLVSKVPELKYLTLGGYTYSGLLCSLRCLRALEILEVTMLSESSYLEMDFIEALASLPKLTDLSLSLPAGIVLDYTGVESGFSSLTKLRVLTVDWKLEDDEPPLTDYYAAITRILPSFPFLQRLRITKTLSFPELFPELNELQLWSIFEPLLKLKRLEHLHYSLPLHLSDQNAARIACAWPYLEDLYFLSAGDESTSPQSPIYLAEHCPNLKQISFHGSLNHHSGTPWRFSVKQFFWNIVELDPMEAPAIALCLHQIFPNLAESTGIGSGWSQVRDDLKSFIFLRDQNRQCQE